jgi:hypothetical protein
MSQQRATHSKRTIVVMFVMTAVGLATAASQEGTKTLPGIALTPLPGNRNNDLSASSGSPSGSADLLKLQRSAAGNPLWSIPLSSLNATRERPVFTPSRRPATIGATPLAQPLAIVSQNRPQFALVGAILGDDEVAILIDEGTKSIARVKKGESYLGWTLHVLEQRKAILHKGPEAMVLTLANSQAK